MSVYTTLIRNYIESFSQYQTGLKLEQRIQIGMSHLFDFDYPIFNEEYRPVLNRNILNHYYFREIGLETMETFKFFLSAKMNLIMPYYNQLYESAQLKLDPLNNHSINESHTKDNTGNLTSNLTSDRKTAYNDNKDDTEGVKSHDLYSDTPQGVLAGGDYATSLNESTNDRTYTSDLVHSGTDDLTSDTKQNVTNLEKFIRSRIGFEGISQSELLLKYRETFINIDNMIIKELGDLFMTVF